MNLEIHNAELVNRVHAHIQAGHFHDADELLQTALDAIDEKAAAPTGVPEKDIEELFAPLRGLNLDFSRNPSTGRAVDL
jgi:Arc/MetJ-type ribon-helix-helix transcriptional regulator